MATSPKQGSPEKMIHIRLPENLHRRLRIRVAELDSTMQEWVGQVVLNELTRQEKEKNEPS